MKKYYFWEDVINYSDMMQLEENNFHRNQCNLDKLTKTFKQKKQ